MLMVIFRTGKAMLPDIDAYSTYFKQRGWEVKVLDYGETIMGKVAVEWHFMGTKDKRIFTGSILIHEYASASVQPFARLKDLYKKNFLSKPDLRIFLNEYVKGQLSFNDDVPYCYRDIGIPSSILEKQADIPIKEYDFIFAGSMHPYASFRRLLKKFTEPGLRSKSLLVLTNNYQNIAGDWKQYPNIKFFGPVSNQKVFELIRKSRYGINIRPHGAPFIYQTSTKVLEYISCKVPVITTNSHWLTSFTKEHGGKYYILEDDLSNLDVNELEQFSFSFPPIEDLTWDAIISNSGIEVFILSRLKQAGIIEQ